MQRLLIIFFLLLTRATNSSAYNDTLIISKLPEQQHFFYFITEDVNHILLTVVEQEGVCVQNLVFSINITKRKKAQLNFLYVKDNHLGNVSDRKIPVDANSDGIIDYYIADIQSATDYYSFGAVMPGRKFNTPAYRYGFNGKEKVDEMDNVEGADLDFGARMYESRLGRFFSTDPYEPIFCYQTSYSFAENSPIESIDKDGEFRISSKDRLKYRSLNLMLKTISNMANQTNAITNPFIQQFIIQSHLDEKYSDTDDQLDAVRKILSYGSGPQVKIKRNVKDGGGLYISGDDFVQLDKKFVKDFEKWDRVKNNPIRNKGRRDLQDSDGKWANRLDMFVSIWHEGIHYQHYQWTPELSDVPGVPDEEAGNAAEMSQPLFGFDVNGEHSITSRFPSPTQPPLSAPYFGRNEMFDKLGIKDFFRNLVSEKPFGLTPGKYVNSDGVGEICPAYKEGTDGTDGQRHN